MNAKANFIRLAFYGALSVLWILLWRRFPQIADENQAMENFEAACLIAGMFLFIVALVRANNRGRKVLLFSLTLFYFTVLLLEMDTRQMDVPSWVVRITNGKIRDIWLGSFWVVAAVLFFRQPRGILSSFFSWLSTTAGKLLICSGIFWAVALIAEKAFHVSFFVEEILECNGALLMAHAGYLTLREVQSDATVQPVT